MRNSTSARRGVSQPGRAAVVGFLWLGFLLLVLGGAGVLHAQISPGALAKAHQSISGMTQCTSCHRFATAGGGLKCLECHTEINQRLTANQHAEGQPGVQTSQS